MEKYKFFGLFSQNKLKKLSVTVRVLFQHSQLNNNSERSKKTELSILKSKDPKIFAGKFAINTCQQSYQK